MNGKKWYLSKTFYFNILALIVAVAGAFGFAEHQVGTEWTQAIGIVVTIVNLVLRLWFTKEPVTA